jgi:hypothetical protein
MHDGATGGFRTAMAFDPVKKRGVVVLTNAAVEPSATDLALHVLYGAPVAPEKPIPPAPRQRTAISLPAGDLDKLAGTYVMTPAMSITVTREGDHLLAQLTGQPAFPIFAEAPREFFWRVVDAQLSFTVDAAGNVIGAVLHQNGHDLAGKRTAP